MVESLIAILIVGLILALIYFIATKLPFMGGVPLQILGIILAIVWIIYALDRIGILGSTHVRL